MTPRRYRVIGNNVFVQPLEKSRTTSSGLFIPETVALDAHALGIVVAVGYLTGPKVSDRIRVPDLSVGDVVMYLRALERTDCNPQLCEILGEKLIRIRPADILLVMDAQDAKQVQ